jgi:hypothetical protein
MAYLGFLSLIPRGGVLAELGECVLRCLWSTYKDWAWGAGIDCWGVVCYRQSIGIYPTYGARIEVVSDCAWVLSRAVSPGAVSPGDLRGLACCDSSCSTPCGT